MMTIQEMARRKRELGYTNEMIAQKSGVPLGTVQKVFAGQTKAPRLKTIQALEAVLLDEKPSAGFLSGRQSFPVTEVHEPEAVYGQTALKKEYTLEDYYALPDDQRVELIDGKFYDMGAPSTIHQLILGDMFNQLYDCAFEHPDCKIFFAPVDVCPDPKDKKTIVQPDLLIVCGDDDKSTQRINRPPDFIAEILSDSTRYHDMFRKFVKYKETGVREYWIVDPKNLKVTVYDFEQDLLPETYTFEDEVALRISDGRCKVDFKRVYDRIKRYL